MSSPAAMVIILKIDPGSYCSLTDGLAIAEFADKRFRFAAAVVPQAAGEFLGPLELTRKRLVTVASRGLAAT